MTVLSLSRRSVFQTGLGLFCLFICVTLPLHAFAISADENPTRKVLVINSYHPGYFWSDDIMEGIRHVLGAEDDVEIFIEYLDTKRHYDAAHCHYMAQIIRHKYDGWAMDAIITSDDNALDFMLDMRAEFLTATPLVFCGIDRADPARIGGYEPIYGVEERDGTPSTIDLMLSLHPGISTIFFVSDATRTGEVMLERIRNMESSYEKTVEFAYLVGMTAAELEAALGRLPEESAVLYLSLIRDRSGKIYSIRESMEMVASASKVPVYCTWGFRPGTGVVGGDILSGFVQGEMSAQIALRLLRNEDPATISPVLTAPT
ncbi:ABC transporter substrate-binding protein [Candidatus Eisenbacteria bacterium]|uniref:ABC transporter substrate-binding protein n=1 Tax=Eiseniibacteriota bacterium TaxID=2212470 RepID=A0ABV6YQ41_UNCEI